jgi:hypothetical protein
VFTGECKGLDAIAVKPMKRLLRPDEESVPPGPDERHLMFAAGPGDNKSLPKVWKALGVEYRQAIQ